MLHPFLIAGHGINESSSHAAVASPWYKSLLSAAQA